jgi:hypothetical protein
MIDNAPADGELIAPVLPDKRHNRIGQQTFGP